MAEPVTYLSGRVTVHAGNCIDVLAALPEASVDSVVTDPPYHLTGISKPRKDLDNYNGGRGNPYARRQSAMKGFMGKTWDGGQIAHDPATWAAVARVMKPGAHLVAFHAPKNWHRQAAAIEDAGLEIRDNILWLFGAGFPKSHNIGKALDRMNGAEREVVGKDRNFGKSRLDDGKVGYGDFAGEWNITAPATPEAQQWDGWGTALKPAYEPIVLARKPLVGTVAQNVLAHGTGAINIDGCRVSGAIDSGWSKSGSKASENIAMSGANYARDPKPDSPLGRWPANIVHDGSEEVIAAFPETGAVGHAPKNTGGIGGNGIYGGALGRAQDERWFADSGSAARFFYSAKADSNDRIGSRHPTVKPVDLMQWLCRLITPPGGTILDPFAGTGTTGEAACREGFNAILIEREAEYLVDIERRMALCLAGPDEKAHAIIKVKGLTADAGPLFGGAA